MPDNVTADPGSGGATFATDQRASDSVHFPLSKLVWGPLDTFNVVEDADTKRLPVKVGDALPAGTNAIGKLAANSGVDIGDVDVASVVPGTGATNLGKAVDSASGATDTGVAPLAIRDDGLSALTPVEGDYIPLRVDANGALWVIPSGTVAISAVSLPLPAGAATAANQSTANTALSAIQAAVETLDNAIAGTEMQVDVVAALPAGTNNIGDVDVLTMPGTAAEAAALPAVFVVVAGDDGTDTHPLQQSATGDLKVTLDSEAIVLGAGAASIGVLGANSGVDIGDVTLNNGFAAVIGGGGEASALRVTIASDSTGVVSVDDNGGALTVDNAGTFAVQVDGAALTALQLIDDPVFSDDGAFTPGTSKVFAVGFLADETAPDSVDEGDVGCPRMTLDRKVWAAVEQESSSMRIGGVAATPKFAIIDAATSGNNTLVAAVAGKKIRVLAAFLVAAGTVNTRFESGADGTALSGQMNLVANNGFVLPWNPYGWFETAATTLLNLELSAAVSVDGCLVYVEV
jgi:hypothetical protein